MLNSSFIHFVKILSTIVTKLKLFLVVVFFCVKLQKMSNSMLFKGIIYEICLCEPYISIYKFYLCLS